MRNVKLKYIYIFRIISLNWSWHIVCHSAVSHTQNLSVYLITSLASKEASTQHNVHSWTTATTYTTTPKRSHRTTSLEFTAYSRKDEVANQKRQVEGSGTKKRHQGNCVTQKSQQHPEKKQNTSSLNWTPQPKVSQQKKGISHKPRRKRNPNHHPYASVA